MPFVSKSQMKKCFALKAKGKNGSWNCKEWARKTNYKSLANKAGRKRRR